MRSTGICALAASFWLFSTAGLAESSTDLANRWVKAVQSNADLSGTEFEATAKAGLIQKLREWRACDVVAIKSVAESAQVDWRCDRSNAEVSESTLLVLRDGKLVDVFPMAIVTVDVQAPAVTK